MRSALCLLAVLAITASVQADDVPGPIMSEPIQPAPYYGPEYVPTPGPVYSPSWHAGGNSFHIFSGPAAGDGFSSAGYYGGGPVFEAYHAGSYRLPADLPYGGYPHSSGVYGPMMLDLLVIPDMSQRGRPHRRW